MTELILRNIIIDPKESDECAFAIAAKKLSKAGVKSAEGYRIHRRSVDARKKDNIRLVTSVKVLVTGKVSDKQLAILDAVKSVDIPTVEVHISKVNEREEFRQISYVRLACVNSIIGHGTDGYLEAIDYLIEEK